MCKENDNTDSTILMAIFNEVDLNWGKQQGKIIKSQWFIFSISFIITQVKLYAKVY